MSAVTHIRVVERYSIDFDVSVVVREDGIIVECNHARTDMIVLDCGGLELSAGGLDWRDDYRRFEHCIKCNKYYDHEWDHEWKELS